MRGPSNNRLILLPRYAPRRTRSWHTRWRREFNQAFRDRYVLHEASRPGVQQCEIEAVQWAPRPTLTAMATRDRLGFVCEVPAGYRAPTHRFPDRCGHRDRAAFSGFTETAVVRSPSLMRIARATPAIVAALQEGEHRIGAAGVRPLPRPPRAAWLVMCEVSCW